MEYFREPDASMIGMFTRGQFFSFFLIALGLAFIVAAKMTAGLSAKAAIAKSGPVSQYGVVSAFFFAQTPIITLAGCRPFSSEDSRGRRSPLRLRAFHRRRQDCSRASLLVGSIFSWSVMITKLRVVQFARKQTARFRSAFRQDRQPLRLFENQCALSRLAALQGLSRRLRGDDLSAPRFGGSG